MLISVAIILLAALGGMALTYLFVDDEPFYWRLSAGSVIGSAIFGTVGFVVASILGFTALTVLIPLTITLAAMAVFLDKRRRHSFVLDWRRAKDKLQGGSFRKFLSFAYYAGFLLLFWLFFERAMYETSQGIFTGGSQNLGDLPFHLGAIFGFTDGSNLPPQNPSFAGAKFSYPFIADFLTASFMKLGADVKDAMLVQNIAWAFSLLVVLERFVFRLTRDRLAGKVGPALLFFSGGLGFIWFFGDYWQQGKSFFEFLGNLPKDYTISDQFRWGNSLVTLFMTQRSLLLGMPLTILVLGYLWKIFASENVQKEKNEKVEDEQSRQNIFTFSHFHFSTLLVGLLAAMLPLIHLHSLAVLFVVTAFLFVSRPAKWREWIVFGFGVGIVAIPELLWSMSGSATRTSEFFAWYFGWDSGETNILWFWIKNTGVAIPILLVGIYLILLQQRHTGVDKEKSGPKTEDRKPKTDDLLLFYAPFVFLFLVSNAAKLAPWEWDNIKVLIYWYVGSIPFVAFVISWAWQKSRGWKIAAAVCFIALIFSGALDVWRTVSGQTKIKVFDKDAVEIARQIKLRTPPNALFLNAPTYNTAVVLSGRRSLMRYPGHLASHGIDYREREDDVRKIYQGASQSENLLTKYGIEYVLISPLETGSLQVNEDYFRKYPVIVELGQYRVYRIK